MVAWLGLALVLSLPFLFVLARRPVLRRMALRNATRRPREALLVVLGSLLGAAIITGSAVVGDSMHDSIRQLARTHLGPIDELVTVGTRAQWVDAQQKLTLIPYSDVDGVLAMESLPVAAASTQRALALPQTQLRGVDFAAARYFGGDTDATGMSGSTPPPGHAAVTADVARALDLTPGSKVTIDVYGRRTILTVDNVLPRRGVAGFSLDPEPESRNVFVSTTTFDRIAAAGVGSEAGRVTPPDWSILVSNQGGVTSGAKVTDRAEAAIAAQLKGAPAQVLDVKQMSLDNAEATGKSFDDMYTGMGTFGILAGLLLLVNLFVMLSAERKPELGMARAVGMRRSWLVGGFATEGWLYAVVASVLGALAGVGLGRAIMVFAERVFSSEHNRLDLFFAVHPASIARGFAAGLAVAIVTVVVTSIRTSRLNIIRAIRDIPEPQAKRLRRRWLVLGALAAALGAVWTVASIPDQQPYGLLLGPTLVLVGAAPLLGRVLPRELAFSLCSLGVVAWGVLVFVVSKEAAENAAMMVYVLQGVVMTGGAVMFVSLQQGRLVALLRRIGLGRRLALRLGLAYPLARRSRTGLTVAMYALVVFVLTFITTLSHLIGGTVDKAALEASGGYAAVVSSSPANPISMRALAARPGVKGIAPLATTTAEFSRPGEGSSSPGLSSGAGRPTPWNLTAFDSRFLAFGPPKLIDRGGYATDADAWEAVLTNPSLMIVDENFLVQTGGPDAKLPDVGDMLTVISPFGGGYQLVKVAAIVAPDNFIGNGALYGASGAQALFGERLVHSRAYIALKPGVDAERFAAALQGAYRANGAEAVSIAAITDEAFAMWRQMFQLFQGYLALGLLVGIAGLAVVMVRAVRERRRQIGTLRAIGFPARMIGRSFAIEAGFIAVEGTVIGVTLALVTMYNIVANTDAFGEMHDFSVPVAQLAVLLLATVIASLLATLTPARSASRIRPAVALRLTD